MSPTRVARAFAIINGLPHATIFSDRLKGTAIGNKKFATRSIKIWGMSNEGDMTKLAQIFDNLGYGVVMKYTPWGRVRLHVTYSV